MRNKISIAQYNEKKQDLEEAGANLQEAEADFDEIKGFEVVDNCSNCKGIGRVEDGYGDPAFNPYGSMLYKDCPDCDGKGYI